jgi:Flp pilus assembly protein TadD
MRMKAVTAPVAVTDENLAARMTPIPPSARPPPTEQEPAPRSNPPRATPPPPSGDPSPTDPRLLREAILVRVHRGDFAGADQILRERLPAAQRDGEIQAVAAWIQANVDGRGEAAAAKLTAILEATPNAEHALYYRGLVHNLAGDTRAALRDFVAVARLNPRHAGALMEIKRLREALGHVLE